MALCRNDDLNLLFGASRALGILGRGPTQCRDGELPVHPPVRGIRFMFKKLFLAAALIALPLMLSQEKASAYGGISMGHGMPGYGHGIHGYGHRMHGYGHGMHGYGHRISPHRSSHSYSRAVTPHSTYRHGYGGGYGGAYCPTPGYGSGYGRPGFSLRIGF